MVVQCPICNLLAETIDNNNELINKLKNRIIATIGKGPIKKQL